MLLANKFSIASVTVTGDPSAGIHTLSYSNITQKWLTLFLEDDNRQGYLMKDVLLEGITIPLDQDFVRFEATAVGTYPVTWTGSNTITQPKEFVGRMVTFRYGDYEGTVGKSAYNLISANVQLNLGRNSEETMFALGSQDIAVHESTQDEFVCEAVGLEVNRDNYDDFTNNTKKQWEFVVSNTDRFVVNTTNNTRPAVLFDFPVGYVEGFSEDAPLDDLVQETLTLHPVDEVGVANAPARIQVINRVLTY
jgi:hypothetical protein